MEEVEKLPERLNAKKEDFPNWMSQILALAEIVDNRYAVKSMFVWMPYGYDMMLRIKNFWDKEFKKNGIKEMYFPLMVPLEYAEQNDSWWEGFKNEGFWAGTKKKQEFIIRPTGEPAMYPMFSLWIRGHKDLPLRIYENVFSYRYETKQTRPLIRDREIGPWYEIHTVHSTKEEAEKEIELARIMNDKIWKFIAVKPLLVRKPKWECFPGAEGALEYYTIMPNGRVMENGSLNNLGQAYAKKFNIKFTDKDGKEKYAWQTCTGNGERYLSAMISQHGDDSGLVLPPNVAPVQIRIIPIFKGENKENILKKAEEIKKRLKSFRVEIDYSENSVGSKFYESELKGIPLRIEIGENEIRNKEFTVFVRNVKKKIKIKEKNLEKEIKNNLINIQNEMLKKSENLLNTSLVEPKNIEEMKKVLDENKVAKIYWCGEDKCFDKIKKLKEGLDLFGSELKEGPFGNCIVCNSKTKNRAYVANSY
jgi:prolyl-tRNA synthetase